MDTGRLSKMTTFALNLGRLASASRSSLISWMLVELVAICFTRMPSSFTMLHPQLALSFLPVVLQWSMLTDTFAPIVHIWASLIDFPSWSTSNNACVIGSARGLVGASSLCPGRRILSSLARKNWYSWRSLVRATCSDGAKLAHASSPTSASSWDHHNCPCIDSATENFSKLIADCTANFSTRFDAPCRLITS